jgi:hypothetical protein
MGRRMAVVATTTRLSFRGVHSLTTGVLKEKRHGHQYFVEVTTLDTARQTVLHEMQEKIIGILNLRDLTQVLPLTTGEYLVEWIYDQLNSSALGGKLLGVALQETGKNRFISGRSDARVI